MKYTARTADCESDFAAIALPKPKLTKASKPITTKARNIRVNVLSAGSIQTPGLDVFANEDVKAYLKSIIPLGRFGTSDEAAKAALFLASDDSSFVAGAELRENTGHGGFDLFDVQSLSIDQSFKMRSAAELRRTDRLQLSSDRIANPSRTSESPITLFWNICVRCVPEGGRASLVNPLLILEPFTHTM